MFRAGHILYSLWSVAVDVNGFSALAQGATELRLERVIVI